MTGCFQNPSLACKQAPNHDKMAMDVSPKSESSTELSSIQKTNNPYNSSKHPKLDWLQKA